MHQRPERAHDVVSETAATAKEEAPSDPGETVGLLTYVLRYGNLAEDRAGLVAVLDGASKSVRLGRGDGPSLEGNRLRLPGALVSREHATITLGGPGHVLEDRSANGSFVNGERVKATLLADGDLIEIGHCLLSYRRTRMTPALARLREGKPTKLGPTRTLCPELLELAHDIGIIADKDVRVLLLGETGTGKEVVAHHIHSAGEPEEQEGARSEVSSPTGRKKERPFVAVNCAAIPPELFESTLFGHVRGAFTGATAARQGLILAANGGTLFLDEIAVLPDAVQAKLLRVLEDGEVTAVGADRHAPVEVRFMAGTNADVYDPARGFREDLRARLGGFVVRLPPLRERREDLGILVAHVLSDAGVEAIGIEPGAARELFHGPLEGNIRALKQAITTAALLAAPGPIERAHLARVLPGFSGAPRRPRESGGPAAPAPAGEPSSLPPRPDTRPRRPFERSAGGRQPTREELIASLERHQTVRDVAAALGVAERTVTRWMGRLHVEAPSKKRR